MSTKSIIAGKDKPDVHVVAIALLADTIPKDTDILAFEQTPRVFYCNDAKGGWNEFGIVSDSEILCTFL